jgi:hypothetical protein
MARYKLTASAELLEKLQRLQALMCTSIPDADLAAVIEAALTEKLERLEARRFGNVELATSRLRSVNTGTRARQVAPQAGAGSAAASR